MLPCPASARADVAANPARPTFSDNANPMATGHVELEIGGVASDGDQYATPFSVDVGVHDHLELRVFGEGVRHSGGDPSATGLGGVGFMAKAPLLAAQGSRPAIGVLGSIIAVTADDDVGGTRDAGVTLLASGSFGRFGYDANIGVNALGLDQDESILEMPAILAVSTAISGPIGATVEVADVIPLDDQDNRLFLLGAVNCAAGPKLVVDAAFAIGPISDEPTPDWTITVGVTAVLAKLW